MLPHRLGSMLFLLQTATIAVCVDRFLGISGESCSWSAIEFSTGARNSAGTGGSSHEEVEMNYELYADESFSDDFYTVAGYIAPIEEWNTFKPAWFAILKDRPRLGFYSTNDALGLKGPFQGWSEDIRNSRISRLASVIPSVSCIGVAAHLSRRDFEEFLYRTFYQCTATRTIPVRHT
jgi:hypothetical protein